MRVRRNVPRNRFSYSPPEKRAEEDKESPGQQEQTKRQIECLAGNEMDGIGSDNCPGQTRQQKQHARLEIDSLHPGVRIRPADRVEKDDGQGNGRQGGRVRVRIGQQQDRHEDKPAPGADHRAECADSYAKWKQQQVSHAGQCTGPCGIGQAQWRTFDPMPRVHTIPVTKARRLRCGSDCVCGR